MPPAYIRSSTTFVDASLTTPRPLLPILGSIGLHV